MELHWTGLDDIYQILIGFQAMVGFYGTFLNVSLVGEAGIEPTTPGLEGRCSIRLSYSPDVTLTRVGRATVLL